MKSKGKLVNGLPRWTWLILGMALLYIVPSLVLEIVYGHSYSFMTMTDRWVPDGNGGWKAEGIPDHRRPSQPSVNIPLFLCLVPIVLPIVLVVLYLASPLSQFVEKEADYKATKYNPEEYRPKFVEEMPELEDEENGTK